MSKVLAADFIQKLLKEDTQRDSHSTEEYKRWPGKVDMLRLAVAVDHDRHHVTFVNSKSFRIKYYRDNVLVKPTTGLVPMGYFSRKQLAEVLEDATNS